MKPSILAITAVMLGSIACATTATGTKAQAIPADVGDALAREIQPLALHTVTDDGNYFTAQVESSGNPEITNSSGLRQVLIPIGTEQPIRCFVYPKAINLAQTLRLFVNSVVSHVDKHQFEDMDAGEINGVPYLALTTSYIVEQNGEKGGGQVKYFAARGETTTTLCMHDEPGYHKSFARIVTGFIASQKIADAENDPTRKLMVWRAVSVQETDGVRVGVVESRLYEGEAGYAFASSTSTLLPGEKGALMATDEAENQFSNLQGDILEAKYVKILNDAVAYNLGLSLDTPSSYRLDGTYDGQAITQRLNVSAALPDFASQTAQLRKLFATKGTAQPVHWQAYSPANPTKLTDVSVAKKQNGPDAKSRQAVMTTGRSAVDLQVDDMGTQMRVSQEHVTMERVWQTRGDQHS